MTDRQILLDVSRLVWRIWTGRLPTGIDRVCLAYLDHFGSRARAVVQRGRLRLVLSPQHSRKLFALLRRGSHSFKRPLIALLSQAAARGSQHKDLRGAIYLNIGHTGLESRTLPSWLRRLGVKPVFLVHDLIPISHPQFCRDGEADKHRNRMINVLRSATGVIANSAATRDALAEFSVEQKLPLPETLVAWLGTEHRPIARQPVAKPRPYFVMIGTIEARKNHMLALSVWRQLVKELGDLAPDLYVIGQRGWEADHVFDALDSDRVLADHVHELGRCNDETMLGLIDGARALLMPSFIEGFGIPVIEALHRGTPVIASDLPVFHEISSQIPLFLDPNDAAAWRAAVVDFCKDSPERNRQLALMGQFVTPDWNQHFAKVDAWLETL